VAEGSDIRRELGVGLIYDPRLEPLLESFHSEITVMELEPQTWWEKISHGDEWRYRLNPTAVDRLADFPGAKLMHGIGQPVGGSVSDPVEHLTLLRATADRLDAVWVSEHLSFNRVVVDGGIAESGFLLPPRQHAAGISVAARNVADYGRALGRPVAFETGVNYLSPGPDEMADGQFWGAVAERAGSGILLDLHNLWCNEVNGRVPILDVIGQLPLDRVWEIHLAGGMELAGYWLDAHSGRIPDPLVEIAAEVIPRLPNLGAILYEVLPEHVDALGMDVIGEQVATLSQLWKLRAPSRITRDTRAASRVDAPTPEEVASVGDWEMTLYQTICGSPRPDHRYSSLENDPGVGVYRELVADFRRSSLARALRYTVTMMLLGLGGRGAARLFDAFFAECPAQAYRAVEADNFARFLVGRTDVLGRVRYLREVLNYEHALIRATVHGADSRIEWTADPTAILGSLERGRLPQCLPPVSSEMMISS
jgi:uncharacterized protein